QNIPKKFKTRKQASLSLLGLKNLILRKPREKSSPERKVSSDVTPPAFPKRSPPLPPNRPLPSQELAQRSELAHAIKSPEINIHQLTHHPDNKQNPIPPHKPKLLFKLLADDSSPNKGKFKETEESKPGDTEASSPDYIVPDMHPVFRTGQKKSSDAKLKQIIEKFDKTRKCREDTLQQLSPPTPELLKKANRLSFPVQRSTMFYISKTRSYPNLGIFQPQEQSIYLQLI
ncbi:hypothetical protein NPIL_121581, partial [Nephila pilipes]